MNLIIIQKHNCEYKAGQYGIELKKLLQRKNPESFEAETGRAKGLLKARIKLAYLELQWNSHGDNKEPK